MQTLTTNASNWTGEMITVKVTKALSFNLNGYKFQVTDITRQDGGGWCTLIGDQWEEELTTLIHIDEKTDLQLVEQAVKWVCNHV
jgi:hypothetical protein